MNVILFEDKQVPSLYPVTTGRPAYTISCGGWRLVDWVSRLPAQRAGVVRPHLTTSQLLDFPEFTSLNPDTPWTLLANARLVPSLSTFRQLCGLLDRTEPFIVRAGSSLSAAMLPTSALPKEPKWSDLAIIEQYIADHQIQHLDTPLSLIEYPHDVIRHHLGCFPENLDYRLQSGEFEERSSGLFVAEDASLGEGLVADTSHGPIVVDSQASVGPHSYLAGPVYIGPYSRVIEHSAIKDHVSISHTAKIGGEVEASIIEAYSNKQHHGFLGHSYLGSWINLGAGTCNSDLKNTYGEVKMEYAGKRVSTGMQFIGCLMGDYSKSAINTGVFTGKTIGVCSMLYGFVTTNVPSFVNYARSFGQITEMPPAVMVSTQKRMFQRRNVQQRPSDVQLIYDMYELTRHERQLAEEPLNL